jgi:6,7-dimethyl-8-ribityllumazine synthase
MSLDSPSVTTTSGAGLRFGVVASRFNQELVDGLLKRVAQTFAAAGVREKDVASVRVPGSHEVPWAAGRMAESGKFDCVIALGVLIGGDTNHHEMVGQSVSHALQQVALTTGVPVINGVIVTDKLAQARERCIGKIDRGSEFAHAALDMAALARSMAKRSRKKS